MDLIDVLMNCKFCQDLLKDPRILPCQHTFCYVCLKSRAEEETKNKIKCPTCFKKFLISVEDTKKNEFMNIIINLKTCGVCKEKEAEDFCEECDQSFCMNCGECHNNMTLLKNHLLVRLSEGEHKKHSELNVFCEDCDEFLELRNINLHEKHMLQKKELGIEKRLLKWKEEVKNITDCSTEYKKDLITVEENWSGKKEELIKMKSQLEDKYQEFIEFLKQQQKVECDTLDSEIVKIELKLVEYKNQNVKKRSSLKRDKSEITKKILQIKRGLEGVLNDKSSYKVPPLLPPLNLQHPFAFKPSSTDALSNLLPSIKNLGQYELKTEMPFEEDGSDYLRHDAKYLYACYEEDNKIGVHSLDTLQLIQTIQCPEGIEPKHVVRVENTFCVSDGDNIAILDDSGAVLDEIIFTEKCDSFKYNGSGKVIITCSDDLTVYSYDVDTRKLDTVPTPSVQWIYQCFAMGRDEYCMEVQINDGYKIIKCVLGNILQKYDVGEGYNDVFIKDGEWVFVSDDDNKKIHILDGDLQLISSLPIDSTGDLDRISVDSEWNIHLSIWDSSVNFYNIRTYQLKW